MYMQIDGLAMEGFTSLTLHESKHNIKYIDDR